MAENLGTGEIFSDVTYFIYIFFGGKFSTPKNNFLSIYFLPKSSSWLKIAIIEYRIDLKASEACKLKPCKKRTPQKQSIVVVGAHTIKYRSSRML